MEGRPDLTTIRRLYAEELRAVARLRTDALIEAFASVRRECFLGSGPWQILASDERGHVSYRTTPDADPRHLYCDVLVALDADRLLNNGLPSALAGWFDALDLRSGETVVHVGCGTGYYTAILAEVVGPHGRVVGIEIDPKLARLARDNLSYLNHVEVFEGDGSALHPSRADAIVVNAGATHVCLIWINSLRPNGRLLVPITASADAGGIGAGGMFMMTRRDGSFEARFISEIVIFPCLGARDAALNRQLSNKDRREWRSVRSLRLDPHEPQDTCWLHAQDCCLSCRPFRGVPSNPALERART